VGSWIRCKASSFSGQGNWFVCVCVVCDVCRYMFLCFCHMCVRMCFCVSVFVSFVRICVDRFMRVVWNL